MLYNRAQPCCHPLVRCSCSQLGPTRYARSLQPRFDTACDAWPALAKTIPGTQRQWWAGVRALFVHHDAMVVLTARKTAATGVLPVLADATVAMGHIATHGPGLLADLFHDGHCCNETTSEESPCRRGT